MEKKIEGLLGPGVSYFDLLDLDLLQKQEKQNAEPPNFQPLRPSSAGDCARKLAYQYMEYKGYAKYEPEVKDPALIRLLDLGSSIEYHLLKLWGKIDYFKIEYKQQRLTFFKVSEKEIIEGSIDFCIYLRDFRAIGDVKSKKDKFSSWRKSEWDAIDEKLSQMQTVQVISHQGYWVEDLPAFLDELNDQWFAANFLQLNMYACNQFIKERGIDHAFIAQYNKNDSRVREIRFKPSQELADYVEKKFKSVADAINNHKEPELIEQESLLGSMRCAFCRFKKNCWPESDALKLWFKTFPDKKWPQDTSRLDSSVAEHIEGLYEKYKEVQDQYGVAGQLEEKIVMSMRAANISKIRFADGNIYELKHLKSPPRIELRRSKL